MIVRGVDRGSYHRSRDAARTFSFPAPRVHPCGDDGWRGGDGGRPRRFVLLRRRSQRCPIEGARVPAGQLRPVPAHRPADRSNPRWPSVDRAGRGCHPDSRAAPDDPVRRRHRAVPARVRRPGAPEDVRRLEVGVGAGGRQERDRARRGELEARTDRRCRRGGRGRSGGRPAVRGRHLGDARVRGAAVRRGAVRLVAPPTRTGHPSRRPVGGERRGDDHQPAARMGRDAHPARGRRLHSTSRSCSVATGTTTNSCSVWPSACRRSERWWATPRRRGYGG